jgi:hypothetical protein
MNPGSLEATAVRIQHHVQGLSQICVEVSATSQLNRSMLYSLLFYMQFQNSR